jgi:hypothetical protein
MYFKFLHLHQKGGRDQDTEPADPGVTWAAGTLAAKLFHRSQVAIRSWPSAETCHQTVRPSFQTVNLVAKR